MPGVGQQFDFDRFPQALRGGMRTYPYGGIVSGLALSNATIATGTLTIPYAAGVVRLDGKQYSIASGNVTRTGLANSTTYTYELFVKPTYLNAVVTSVPSSAPAGGTGNYRLYCTDMGDYFKLVNFYKYANSAWAVHDPIFDPPTEDYGNLIHNEITAATIGFETDKMVYNKTASVPFVSQPADHYVRYDAAFKFATYVVTVAANGASVTSTITYDEVTAPV